MAVGTNIAVKIDPDRKDVWVPDTEQGYLPGYVVKENGDQSMVCLSSGQTVTVPTTVLSEMNPPKFEKVADIADLTFLNEASVVHNLRQRYFSDLLYTYSGLFLVAVNPYHALPIYTEAVVDMYKGQRREANPPHIFAVADGAFRNMLRDQENQSLLITGESGAGKTESTKRVIQYLAAVAVDADADANVAHAPRRVSHAPLGLLERQILQANPILEAFGNAQTVRNNNSSRFGKFIRIEFTTGGAIAGGNIDWYLLEKSRVHNRSANERNFHIFYQLLRSRDKALLSEFQLSNFPDAYKYLNGSRKDVEGVDDSQEWIQLLDALCTMGFSAEEKKDLFRVIAAILHLGNLDIAEDRSEQARITNPEQLALVSELIGVEPSKLSTALVRPTVRAGRETVSQSRSKKQVVDEIAALSKTMYEKTFGWLVSRINHVLDRPTSKSRYIGVLDIAGFEIFGTNSFEQLCINYTNERLQQFFNHHMFMLEQEEYAREDIKWDYVNFGLDLQPTIDLIESTSPIGVLATLDEECIMPKATDQTFTDKLTSTWGSKRASTDVNQKFVASRQVKRFVVRHYAANVEYNTEQWLDKNRDPLNENVARVLAGAEASFIGSLFAEFQGECVMPRGRRGAFRTVGQRHKEQLASLMAQLSSTQPHFVRCIVPNNEKKPGKMDLFLVLDQLRCNGVLEGIRIARLGYPNRTLFSEFCTRYALLVPDVLNAGAMDRRVMSQRIAQALGIAEEVYKVGLTKIFFKAGVLAELEEQRDAYLRTLFTHFQAMCRRASAMRIAKKRLRQAAAQQTLRDAAVAYDALQRWPWWRMYMSLLPLLSATQDDEARKHRELQVAMEKERAQRDERERAALESLKTRLAAENAVVVAALDEERAKHASVRDQITATTAALVAAEKNTDELRAELAQNVTMHSDFDAQLAKLEQNVAHMHSQLEESSQREQEAAHDMKSLSAHLDAVLGERGELERDKEDATAKLLRAEEALQRMHAASNEQSRAAEAHVRDLAAQHEQEMQSVRASLESHRATSQKAAETHASQLAKADAQLAQLAASLAEHTVKYEQEAREAAAKHAAVEKALTLAEERAAEAEQALSAARVQHAELQERSASDATKSNALLSELDSVRSEQKAAQKALDAERSEKQGMARRVASMEEQQAALLAQSTAQHDEVKKLRDALKHAELENKRLDAMQSKTIVEHVHVLEEAKKYTDRQLSDVQTELQELTTYTRSLERTRAKLQQDNEQLTRAASQSAEPPAPPKEVYEERDKARSDLLRAKQAADLTLRQTRAEYETRIQKLEEEMRKSQRNSSLVATDRVLSDLRSERKMSSAARKVLEELRLENERLEQDLAAKASALRTTAG